MSPDDIDRILASEIGIAPSPAFTASVMRAIERETRTLPPLAFPWRQALPGWVALVACLVAGSVGIAGDGPVQALQTWLAGLSAKASTLQLHWVALSILVTAFSLMTASTFVRRRAHSWEGGTAGR